MKNEQVSAMTKQEMADSLKRFMKKKPFNKITVKDIITDFHISRPTFYYHFDDIYALLE